MILSDDGASSLTVVDTNTEQSGSLLRARVSNEVATAYSHMATLTVNPRFPIPPGGLDVEGVVLEWSGSAELQSAPPVGGSNYFSAGVSSGDEATYRSSDGDVTISEPDDGEQAIVVEVPDPGPGELVWTIAGTGPVTLGPGTDAGDHWRFDGEIHPIVVTDTRNGSPAWSIAGQVGDFTGGLPGRYLGWSPKLVTPGGGAAPGDSVPSGLLGGDGLSVASSLAAAPSGHDLGSATIGADLDLRVPIATGAGTYTATLTITALG